MKNNSIACRTTWQIFTTTSGTLKQLYERFSPHINKGCFSSIISRETFRTVIMSHRVYLFKHVYMITSFTHQQISSVIPLNSHADLCMQVLQQRSLFVRLAFNVHIQAGLSLTGQLRSAHTKCILVFRGV